MEPINRREVFLNALAKGEPVPIEPLTREEVLLARQAEREAGGSGGGGYDAIIRYNDLNFTTPELLSGSYDNLVAKVRGGEFVNVLIYGTDNNYNVKPVRIINILADWDESFYVMIKFKHPEVDVEYSCCIMSNDSVA